MVLQLFYCFCFFFNDTATTEIYTYLHTLSLHDALPIFRSISAGAGPPAAVRARMLERASSAIRTVSAERRRGRPITSAAAESRSAAVIRPAVRDRKSTRLNSSH